MHPDAYDFSLPEELIAQFPAERRDASRLMVLDRSLRSIREEFFPAIAGVFRPGDVLVLNDTRVIPARLLGHKESGGQIEVLLVRRLAGSEEVWHCLTRSSKPPRIGSRLLLPAGITGVVEDGGEPPYRQVHFSCSRDFAACLEEAGRIPLPPYIRREADEIDRERYQTVFAANPGAVAAPTAGLHFTPELLDSLRALPVEIVPLTLHVGLGTFLPVRSDNLDEHRMHAESYFIPEGTASAVNRAKCEGRRVFALGTTTTRALEHVAASHGCLVPGAGTTEIFIRPGFRFRMVDGLITNFHLPKSTLLMLVSAFAGRDFVLEAYRRAVVSRFRFFSYGDGMVII